MIGAHQIQALTFSSFDLRIYLYDRQIVISYSSYVVTFIFLVLQFLQEQPCQVSIDFVSVVHRNTRFIFGNHYQSKYIQGQVIQFGYLKI